MSPYYLCPLPCFISFVMVSMTSEAVVNIEMSVDSLRICFYWFKWVFYLEKSGWPIFSICGEPCQDKLKIVFRLNITVCKDPCLLQFSSLTFWISQSTWGTCHSLIKIHMGHYWKSLINQIRNTSYSVTFIIGQEDYFIIGLS